MKIKNKHNLKNEFFFKVDTKKNKICFGDLELLDF